MRFENKKVLVTGGAGFIGSNLVDKLVEEGASVTVLDDLFTGRCENISRFKDIKFIEGSVTDYDLVARLVKSTDYVFNLAVRNIIVSTVSPILDFQVNIGGTFNVLLAAKTYGVERVVFSSSASIYGNPRYLPINEDDPISALNPYAASKLSGENYCSAFYESYGVPVTALRYSNVYGPRQNYESEAGVVAIFINRILENEEIFIFGNGEQTRDFVYVNDVADVNLLMADKKLNGCFNVCTSVESSVNDIFRELAEILDYTKKPTYLPPKDGELFRSSLSFKLLREKLNWTSEEKLSDGLRKTVEYFREIKN